VTARDFQFTHEAFVAHYEDPDRLYVNVQRTRVIDAKTFLVVMRKPFAAWRYLYDIVLPRHALAGQDVMKVWRDGVDDPRTGRPIGSGPFLFSRFERGRQLTLVRNPRYWGAHLAYLDRIVQRFIAADSGDPLAFVRGRDVDLGFTLGGPATLSADDAREIGKVPGWRTAAFPSPGMEHFAFRVGPGGHPALRLKLVRQALAFGIDRVAIAREIQQDVPAASRRPLDSTVFLPTEPYYRANWSGYRYDVAKARRLLEQAGCRRGSGGFYECSGERLHLRFVTSAGVPVRERVVSLAAAQLREVGIEVEPVYAPQNVFLGQILPKGDFDAALFAWGSIYGGVFVWPEALCGSEQNFGGYCSRLVTRDSEQNLIGSLAARARVLNHVDVKLATAVPVLPVVQPVFRMFYRRNIRGLGLGGTQFELQQDSENWWLADER
jgi:peptide/nickel transport system substrate-binding protein